MHLAIIPARSGSTRIKNKNIIDFCGKPLIARPLEAARDSGLFGIIHVSTDSKRYAEIVRELGFQVEFLRDPSMAENHIAILDLLRWVVREFKKRGQHVDDVCLIYATASLIEADDLKRAYTLYMAQDRRIPVLSVASFPAPFERGFHIQDNGILKPLFPQMRAKHSQDLAPAYHDAGAFFFIPADQLLNEERQVDNEALPYILPRHKAVDIDEPEDLEMAETLFLGRAAKKARRAP